MLRVLLPVVLLGCGDHGAPSSPPPVSPPEVELPGTVVLVSIDTLKASALSSYGNDLETSPFIDGLAAAGVRFSNAESPAPWTLPAHTTMLTGQSTLTHQVVEDTLKLNPETPVLPEVFRDAGYQTGGFVAALYVSSIYGFDRGFSRFNDFDRFTNDLSIEHRVPCETVIDEALGWAKGVESDTPLFLFLHFYDVHYDYNPPPPYDTMFDRTSTDAELDYETYVYYLAHPLTEAELTHQRLQYQESMRYVDDQLARLSEQLEALGRTPLWAITSDHGEEFGERGSWGHAHTLYAEQLHIPLILSGPGVPQGVVDDRVVGTEDVAPTLAARIRQGDALHADGSDLLADPPADPAPHLAETSRFRSLRVSLRDGDERLDWELDDDVVELYDRSTDPLELRDLAKERPARVRALREALMDRLASRWTSHARGAMRVKNGVVLARGRARARVVVRPGTELVVLPYTARVSFSARTWLEDGKYGWKSVGTWGAVPDQRPPEDSPLSYRGAVDLQAVSADKDDAVKAALEALGYVQHDD